MQGYLFASFIGVSNMVLWGIYGDLLLERFSIVKVARSLVVGTVISIYLYILKNDLPLIVVALITIALERLFTEVYKALIREESQRKYKIPSDLNVDLPRPFEIFLGIFLLTGMLFLLALVDITFPKIAIILASGLVAGVGGMMKDAPYEGFYLFKFFRSPFVSIIVGLLLYYYFPLLETKYFLLAIFGGERVLSEFYKKIYRGRGPGKFKNDRHHHIHYGWKVKRVGILLLYILDVTMLLFISFF